MLSFTIDEQKCTRCNQCVRDCPVNIITMDTGYPSIASKKEGFCFKCQHCLAVCPTGALSILGKKPEDSIPLDGNLPDPDKLEVLLKGRRSVRQYKDENLEPEVLQRLLEVAIHAPTGVNARGVHFTVVDDREVMGRLRREMLETFLRLKQSGELKGGDYFREYIERWEKTGRDTILRGAPHLVVASAPHDCATPEADCLIALSYFEIFAQSLGVGTVWNGLFTWTLKEILPEFRHKLGIPEDHLIGYTIAFGKPAVTYRRTVQHPAAPVSRVAWDHTS